jgi:hypothetical protein
LVEVGPVCGWIFSLTRRWSQQWDAGGMDFPG